jgi:hypothetical protein
MTAIRNFPNAPLARRTSLPLSTYVPAFAAKAWQALYRYGQLRAARELDVLADRRALGDPVLARQLRAAAAECRQGTRPVTVQGEGSSS